MLSYGETMDRLLEMRDRFDSGFSPSDRVFIRETYVLLFRHDIKNIGCSDCYKDAYVEIIHKLKKTQTMPKEKKFILRAGVLLHAFNGEVFTNANLTDEIAMDALNENVKRFDLFAKVPDNWKDLCKARKTLTEKEQTKKEGVSKEELQDTVESLKSTLTTAQADLSAANAEIEFKNSELSKVKEELEKAVKEADANREALEKARLSYGDELKAKNDEIVTLTQQKVVAEQTNQDLAAQVAKLEAEVEKLKKAATPTPAAEPQKETAAKNTKKAAETK